MVEYKDFFPFQNSFIFTEHAENFFYLYLLKTLFPSHLLPNFLFHIFYSANFLNIFHFK